VQWDTSFELTGGWKDKKSRMTGAKAKVSLIRCCDYDSRNVAGAIQRHFDLLGGVEKFISYGERVLLKPNLIAPKPRDWATQTDPVVVIETARLLKDYGAKPIVGDSPAWGKIENCAKAIGLDEPLKKLGVPLKQLNKSRVCRIGDDEAKVGISEVALAADKIINMPKFKAHQQVVATFAVKNMFGCVAGKKKAYWHFAKGKSFDEFCGLLIDIYKFLNPVMSIIDGVVAMDSGGPIHGRARQLGWIIAGTEPIACERVCCELVNFNAGDLPIINTAKKNGFGAESLGEIEIVGDEYSNLVCMDFEHSQIRPLKVTFRQVVKSIAKQIIFLTKNLVNKLFNRQ